MKHKIALALLPIVLCGCFRPSPGGLEGVWELRQEFDAATTFVEQTLRYTFDGNRVVRVLEQDIRLKATGESVVLRTEESGEIFVTDDVAFDYLDVNNITREDYPTTVEFAVAGAILGYTASQQELFYGEPVALTLQGKGAFAIVDGGLRIKFGSAAVYPTNVDPPFVYELEKVFALFP